MVEATAGTWTIEIDQESVRSGASEIAADLRKSGVSAPEPTLKVGDAMLGVPEILITILAASAAKAAIAAGLRALQTALERQIDAGLTSRAQIILLSPQRSTQRFPLSLRNLGKDALRELITRVIAAVDKL